MQDTTTPISPQNMKQPVWNFEQEPYDERTDETTTNLRAYFDRMDDRKMREYDPTWSDEKLVEWDGLLVPCCERDIEVEEYRRVLEQAIQYRDRARGKITEAANQ